MIEIFIPGNVPSSKNSKVWTGKLLINSKLARSYITDTAHIYKKYTSIVTQRLEMLKAPYPIEFTFIRKSRHSFDYINALQIVQDLMVMHGWLIDDNADVLIPMFRHYEYNKDNPGVYISI